MEENIDDILDNISNNFFSQQRNGTNTRTQVNPSNHTNPSMRFVNRQLDTIYDTIMNYNSNMIQYHANIREMLRLINVNSMNHRIRINEIRRQQTQQTTQNSRIRQPQNRNNTFLYTNWTRPFFNQPRQQTLTPQEIEQYTTTFSYTEQSQEHVRETRCPISLDNFQYGDTLCQIVACGHVFLKHNLLYWFRRSNQCPLCRHNLTRNTQPNVSQNTDTLNTDISGNEQNAYNTLEQEMVNIMQNFIDMTIADTSTNYDLSINTIPLTRSFILNNNYVSNQDTSTNDVSNNDNIEGDMSVD